MYTRGPLKGPFVHSKRPFLLLELLIALLLVTSFLFPLAEIPMRALREEMKSLYRMQISRLADVGYAKVREALYKKDISWEDLEKGGRAFQIVFEHPCSCSLSPISSKKFIRKGSIKLVSKKVKNEEEWCLLMALIEIAPEQKKEFPIFKRQADRKKDYKKFAYYTIIHKKNAISTKIVP